MESQPGIDTGGVVGVHAGWKGAEELIWLVRLFKRSRIRSKQPFFLTVRYHSSQSLTCTNMRVHLVKDVPIHNIGASDQHQIFPAVRSTCSTSKTDISR